jgi:hypothetical protein
MQRHRFKQTQSLQERLSEQATRLRAEATLLPPGALRDEVIRKMRQTETALQMSDLLASPGLQSPK